MKIFKHLPIAAVVLLTSFSSTTFAADVMKGLEGVKRPLLIFTKSRSDAQLDRQVDLLRGFRPDLKERDVVVLRTSGNEETRSAVGYTPIDRGTARVLRKRFEPASIGMTVVLVGKDGSEKKRWNRLVQPQEIFDLIDSMPMRLEEMKKLADG